MGEIGKQNLGKLVVGGKKSGGKIAVGRKNYRVKFSQLQKITFPRFPPNKVVNP